MSATTIERKIAYNMALGNKLDLFEPINVESYALFSLQFLVTGQTGAVNGTLTLKVSNDGINFKAVAATTITLDTNAAGTQSYYIFIGSGSGISAVTHVSADFVKSGITAGTIEKVIFMGNLGNS